MPTVCILPGNIRIEQRFKEHPPPHFHASRAEERVSVTIAELTVLQGPMNSVSSRGVLTWARAHQRDLALNWIWAPGLMPV